MGVTTSRFPKSSRLLHSAEFQRVFQNTNYKISHRYLLILACRNSFDHPRLGLVVGKKHCRLAVQRNRIKRRARETFRHQQHHLHNIDAIVLPRSGADQLSDQQLTQLFEQQWRRLSERCRQLEQT